MKQKNKIPVVLFNASVVLSGLNSPAGGSAKLLGWIKKRKIKGVISEIIFDEVLKHLGKLKLSKTKALYKINSCFPKLLPAPDEKDIIHFNNSVLDIGDSHLLASAKKIKTDYLVSLDKKHILSLKGKIKWTKIVSPADLIETLSIG